jgi:hypothetical protein
MNIRIPVFQLKLMGDPIKLKGESSRLPGEWPSPRLNSKDKDIQRGKDSTPVRWCPPTGQAGHAKLKAVIGVALEYRQLGPVSNPSSPIISNDKPATAIINHNQKKRRCRHWGEIYPLRPIPTNIYKPILPYERNLVAPMTGRYQSGSNLQEGIPISSLIFLVSFLLPSNKRATSKESGS